jgi:prophage antirepressor-like protein
MNEIQIFKNENFGEVRVAEVNGVPMFCLADVCRVLELTTPSKVRERLNQKGVNSIPTLTNGGTQNLTYINEGNLYKAIFQSRKPEAEAFQDWVTDEVLPSIRKTGSYNMPKTFAQALRLAAEQQEKIEAQQALIEAQKPKAEYYDALVDRKCLLNFTDTAKELKIARTALINILLENKWIYRNNGKDLRPYAKYVEKGYFEMKEFHNENRSNTQTLITVAGRDAIMNKLLNVKIK